MPRYGHKHEGQRGRYRGRRWIERFPEKTYFRPSDRTQTIADTVVITVEELEALRLVDLEDLTQEEAAAMMGVSRRTLWNDLQCARKKTVDALVNGHAIHIKGGDYVQRE